MKLISNEWKRLADGTYARVVVERKEIKYQPSFADTSNFMPNINGISENLSGSTMIPQYDFDTPESEYDNSAIVAARSQSLDITEVEALTRSARSELDKQVDNAKEALEEEALSLQQSRESSSGSSESA